MSKYSDSKLIVGEHGDVNIDGTGEVVVARTYSDFGKDDLLILVARWNYAHDLLNALQEILAEYEAHGQSAYCQVGAFADVTAKAHAAIANANGVPA